MVRSPLDRLKPVHSEGVAVQNVTLQTKAWSRSFWTEKGALRYAERRLAWSRLTAKQLKERHDFAWDAGMSIGFVLAVLAFGIALAMR